MPDPQKQLDELNTRIIWLKTEIVRLMKERKEINLGDEWEDEE